MVSKLQKWVRIHCRRHTFKGKLNHPGGPSEEGDWSGIISSLNGNNDSRPRKRKKMLRVKEKKRLYDELINGPTTRKRKASPKLTKDQKTQLFDDVMELAQKRASASSELRNFADWLR